MKNEFCKFRLNSVEWIWLWPLFKLGGNNLYNYFIFLLFILFFIISLLLFRFPRSFFSFFTETFKSFSAPRKCFLSHTYASCTLHERARGRIINGLLSSRRWLWSSPSSIHILRVNQSHGLQAAEPTSCNWASHRKYTDPDGTRTGAGWTTRAAIRRRLSLNWTGSRSQSLIGTWR